MPRPNEKEDKENRNNDRNILECKSKSEVHNENTSPSKNRTNPTVTVRPTLACKGLD